MYLKEESIAISNFSKTFGDRNVLASVRELQRTEETDGLRR